MDAIETRGLGRRYGRTDAVTDLTLSVPEGGVFALIGPNGAGKTTTIKLLMNLVVPSSGTARDGCKNHDWCSIAASSSRNACSKCRTYRFARLRASRSTRSAGPI